MQIPEDVGQGNECLRTSDSKQRVLRSRRPASKLNCRQKRLRSARLRALLIRSRRACSTSTCRPPRRSARGRWCLGWEGRRARRVVSQIRDGLFGPGSQDPRFVSQPVHDRRVGRRPGFPQVIRRAVNRTSTSRAQIADRARQLVARAGASPSQKGIVGAPFASATRTTPVLTCRICHDALPS